MRTPYRIDDFQQIYFVVPSLQELLDSTTKTDFGAVYARLAAKPDIAIAAIEPGDRVFTHGAQTYAGSLAEVNGRREAHATAVWWRRRRSFRAFSPTAAASCRRSARFGAERDAEAAP